MKDELGYDGSLDVIRLDPSWTTYVVPNAFSTDLLVSMEYTPLACGLRKTIKKIIAYCMQNPKKLSRSLGLIRYLLNTESQRCVIPGPESLYLRPWKYDSDILQYWVEVAWSGEVKNVQIDRTSTETTGEARLLQPTNRVYRHQMILLIAL